MAAQNVAKKSAQQNDLWLMFLFANVGLKSRSKNDGILTEQMQYLNNKLDTLFETAPEELTTRLTILETNLQHMHSTQTHLLEKLQNNVSQISYSGMLMFIIGTSMLMGLFMTVVCVSRVRSVK